MTESEQEKGEVEQTRFVDGLDRIYDALEEVNGEARTPREKRALALIHAATDFGRAAGLQREYPTPNQKLYSQVSGEDVENPDDPGSWEGFREQHSPLQDFEGWYDDE